MLRSFNIENIFDWVVGKLRRFQSPWIIVPSVVLSLVGFLCVSSFDSAVTPEEASSLGYPLMPSYWEAGVLNHGEYYRWLTVENHPFLYSVSYAILLVSSLLVVCIGLSIAIDAEIIYSEMQKKYRKRRTPFN